MNIKRFVCMILAVVCFMSVMPEVSAEAAVKTKKLNLDGTWSYGYGQEGYDYDYLKPASVVKYTSVKKVKNGEWNIQVPSNIKILDFDRTYHYGEVDYLFYLTDFEEGKLYYTSKDGVVRVENSKWGDVTIRIRGVVTKKTKYTMTLKDSKTGEQIKLNITVVPTKKSDWTKRSKITTKQLVSSGVLNGALQHCPQWAKDLVKAEPNKIVDLCYNRALLLYSADKEITALGKKLNWGKKGSDYENICDALDYLVEEYNYLGNCDYWTTMFGEVCSYMNIPCFSQIDGNHIFNYLLADGNWYSMDFSMLLNYDVDPNSKDYYRRSCKFFFLPLPTSASGLYLREELPTKEAHQIATDYLGGHFAEYGDGDDYVWVEDNEYWHGISLYK